MALPPDLREVVARVEAQDGETPPVETKPLSKDEERHQQDIQSDIEKGKKIVEEIDKEVKASENEEMKARLSAISGEMAEIATASKFEVIWGDKRYANFPYEFKLIQGDDVNAFSLPGGTIYVYEGLMRFAESDDEIAAVMAHEISHAAFRHMATLEKEYNRLQLMNIPILVAAAMSRDSKAMGALMASQYATQGLVSGWTVQAETSADYGAIQMMAKSRYNPVGMLTFMERLAFRDKFAPNIEWGIYRTHPPSKERANFIIRTLGEYKIPIRRSAVTLTFSARSIPMPEGHFELWFGKEKIHDFRGPEAKERAAKAVLKLNEFLDSVPQMFQVGTSGASVMGRNRELFTIAEDDVIEGQRLENVADGVAASMKRVVFDLSFRLWPGN